MIIMVLCFIVFYLLSVFAGTWADVILVRLGTKTAPVFRLAFGGCTVLAVSMFVSFVCSLAGLPVSVCALIIACALVAVGTAGFFVRKKCMSDRPEGKEPSEALSLPAIVIMAMIVVAQIAAVMSFRHEGTEVVRQIVAATSVFDSGHLHVADPMMLFIGTVSRLLGIHPLRFVFEVTPAIFIVLYYLCYYGLICTVCEARQRTVAFIAVCILNLWGYQSDMLVPATLLLSWFGIWVFIIHGLAAVAAVILIRYVRPDGETVSDVAEDDFSEEWDMKKHRIINARNLAIALGVLAVALLVAVFVLNSKINRLYDATVSLQNDLGNRCSIYEFTNDEGQVEGYLLKGSDGNISFIGGGSSENAARLGEFIGTYTDTVDRWYVYDDDETESGAMRELIGSGKVDARKVYVITREEITGLQ